MSFTKRLAATAVMALGIPLSPVMAQSAFTGFYGQISTGYERNTVDSVSLVGQDYGGVANTSTSATLSSDNMPLVLGVGYNFQLNDRFTLGLGMDYSALTQTTDVAGFSYPQTGSTAVYDYHISVSNRFDLFLAPGYVIDDTKLAYLKLGYSTQQLQYSQTNCCSNPSNKASVNGYLLGVGYKQMISNGLYGFVEANYRAYSRADMSSTYTDGPGGTVSSNPTSKSYNVLLGVGYKF